MMNERIEAELFPLGEAEIERIYNEHMTKDFPENELKPLKAIRFMMERGAYDCLGVRIDGELSGYAFVVYPPGTSFALLDYLAVFDGKRGNGIGGAILRSLRAYYGDKSLVLESEYPPEAPDPEQAEHRLNFYYRNGAENTGVGSLVFGAHYVNLKLSGEKKSAPEMKRALETIYEFMVTKKEHRDRFLSFWLLEDER